MRWRYLILGLFVAIPIGTAIHVWPQRPEYVIEGRHRYFLADEAKTNQLMFICKDQQGNPNARIEYFDGCNGKLVRTTVLDCSHLASFPHWHFWFRASDDGKVLSWLASPNMPRFQSRYASNWGLDEPPAIDLNDRFHLATFDLATGALLNSASGLTGGFVCLAPNGAQFAVVERSPNQFAVYRPIDEKRLDQSQLAVFDMRSDTCLRRVPMAHVANEHIGVCFSPDGRFLAYQTEDCHKPVLALHVISLESPDQDATFYLPKGQMLCDWRIGELRTYEMLEEQNNWLPTRRHRYAFDGKTLGTGTTDPLQDCDYTVLASPNGSIDNHKWITRFEKYPGRWPEWANLIQKIQSSLGVNAIDLSDVASTSGCVRILDRATRSLRFEKHVPSVEQCRIALDSNLLLLDRQKAHPSELEGIECGVAAASFANSPGGPFEVYRTDPWPRWIWTTLGVFGVMAVFALFGRWRYLSLRGRLTSPGPAVPNPEIHRVV